MAGWLAGCPRPRARPGRAARGRQSGRREAGGGRRLGTADRLRTGYRVYFKRQGRTFVVLLAGGDKRSQRDDVETALRLARNL